MEMERLKCYINIIIGWLTFRQMIRSSKTYKTYLYTSEYKYIFVHNIHLAIWSFGEMSVTHNNIGY